ncbi:hypothetical protein C1I98_32490 [Spongiactinospora gelatinilytica]|uniref:AB hydrolase-1 domain-containing protein n=1 Tax=Spongiactinospora gelatinilytica TaxID=2666298 RepID=A0A2W2FVB0_9ACTN|nr:hypothetical protein C1I98_32490 [Spongiactinospora gelatinilytica]
MPGDRQSTPVILLHGGPGAPDAKPSPLEPALTSAGFDVYAHHQVGAGLSNRLPDASGYTVARHVADLDALRVAIRADRVVLVGTSWGATLTAAYLAAHPDRVARAVVTSPGMIWSSAFPGDRHMTASGLRDQTGVLWDRHPRLLLSAVLVEVAGPRATRACRTRRWTVSSSPSSANSICGQDVHPDRRGGRSRGSDTGPTS